VVCNDVIAYKTVCTFLLQCGLISDSDDDIMSSGAFCAITWYMFSIWFRSNVEYIDSDDDMPMPVK